MRRMCVVMHRKAYTITSKIVATQQHNTTVKQNNINTPHILGIHFMHYGNDFRVLAIVLTCNLPHRLTHIALHSNKACFIRESCYHCFNGLGGVGGERLWGRACVCVL